MSFIRFRMEKIWKSVSLRSVPTRSRLIVGLPTPSWPSFPHPTLSSTPSFRYRGRGIRCREGRRACLSRRKGWGARCGFLNIYRVDTAKWRSLGLMYLPRCRHRRRKWKGSYASWILQELLEWLLVVVGELIFTGVTGIKKALQMEMDAKQWGKKATMNMHHSILDIV